MLSTISSFSWLPTKVQHKKLYKIYRLNKIFYHSKDQLVDSQCFVEPKAK